MSKGPLRQNAIVKGVKETLLAFLDSIPCSHLGCFLTNLKPILASITPPKCALSEPFFFGQVREKLVLKKVSPGAHAPKSTKPCQL